MESGLAMGTVCVIDTQPHQVTAEQMQELLFLALQVVDVLRRRRQSLSPVGGPELAADPPR